MMANRSGRIRIYAASMPTSRPRAPRPRFGRTLIRRRCRITALMVGAWPAPARVVHDSWAPFHPSLAEFPPADPRRYIDNPNHTFRLYIRVLTALGADVVFAAGNCGAGCPSAVCLQRVAGTIMGANAYTEVLTLAGCDIDDVRVCYSSQGPSIAGMPQQKPDVTAYTQFLASHT